MKAITIRVGPETHRLLERRAKAFHRSVAQQILFDALQQMELDAFANSTMRAPDRRLSRTGINPSGKAGTRNANGGERKADT